MCLLFGYPPYSYRWIPLSYKPHHYKMLHLVPLILLVCLVMLDLYINQITFFLIVEQLQLVSHLSHMLQDLAGGQLSSESNIDDMDSAIIATRSEERRVGNEGGMWE